ncbi:MAG: DNA mismatch repair endonuclease MutH [Gammaproteobacteria bacterium]|nr:DNA mismatch repair endonuclease MutH [Gammaproteobacteria bacterium]
MLPPKTEQELLQRANELAGKTFFNLSKELHKKIPDNLLTEKGWLGQLLELALGASAGSKPEPDFKELGIELKTLPLNAQHQPKGSTFVCTASLPCATEWQQSNVYQKLKCILWIPIEADPNIPFAERRIGAPILWRLTTVQEKILKQDWEELTEMLTLGDYQNLTARVGTYLQMRPKAANSKVLRESINRESEKQLIVPRGFYLRPHFTKQVLR